MARGVATGADVLEQLVSSKDLESAGWHYNSMNKCWYSPENPLSPRASEGNELIWSHRTRQLVELADVERRLAQTLETWMRDEVGRGFRQLRSLRSEVRIQSINGEVAVVKHQSYGCDGHKEEGARGGYRASLEEAARAFVENTVGGSVMALLNIRPDTHVLVWRIEPELGCFGRYEKRVVAYARFCFVKLPEGATLLDCEEIK